MADHLCLLLRRHQARPMMDATDYDAAPCKAALIIKGEHQFCDLIWPHALPHANAHFEAVWGDVPDPDEATR